MTNDLKPLGTSFFSLMCRHLAMVGILCVCVAPAGAFSRAAPVLPAAGARQCRGGVRGLRSQQGPSKGLNVLELTGALVPQGALVKGVKTGWRLAWATLMRELAPQSKDGDYVRPSYGFTGEIGTAAFPEEPNRYHLYAGAACPWCHRVELVRSVRGLQSYVSLTTVLDRPEGVCAAHRPALLRARLRELERDAGRGASGTRGGDGARPMVPHTHTTGRGVARWLGLHRSFAGPRCWSQGPARGVRCAHRGLPWTLHRAAARGQGAEKGGEQRERGPDAHAESDDGGCRRQGD